jgi:hypothetical protein
MIPYLFLIPNKIASERERYELEGNPSNLNLYIWKQSRTYKNLSNRLSDQAFLPHFFQYCFNIKTPYLKFVSFTVIIFLAFSSSSLFHL